MLTAIEPALDDKPGPRCADQSPSLPRHDAELPGRMPRRAMTWLGRGILLAGLGMLPWLFILARTLPPTAVAAHWSTAWVGLDGLEALGLVTTGLAFIRRYDWLCLPAAITATLLVIDAWFDVTTSAPGSAATEAIAMAVFAELPTAALCFAIAVLNAPGRQRAQARDRRS